MTTLTEIIKFLHHFYIPKSLCEAWNLFCDISILFSMSDTFLLLLITLIYLKGLEISAPLHPLSQTTVFITIQTSVYLEGFEFCSHPTSLVTDHSVYYFTDHCLPLYITLQTCVYLCILRYRQVFTWKALNSVRTLHPLS